jgi:uncharacterized membrane protein YwzB
MKQKQSVKFELTTKLVSVVVGITVSSFLIAAYLTETL